MLAYTAMLDLALTYALRRPRLAAELLRDAHHAAIELGRPDLAFRANDLLSAICA